MRFILFCLFFNLLFGQPLSFYEAKKYLIEIYKKVGILNEFYCRAPFQIKNDKFILIESEAFSPRISKSGKISKRSYIIEWEHILPMSVAYKHFPCWREGGRKKCQKVDENFNRLEGDLFNLVPSIGSINGDRSNYHYDQAPHSLNFVQYGKCKVFTDFKNKRFYPADYSKGYIARTYLYMMKQYKIKLSKKELSLMIAWDEKFPMDETERRLRIEISKVMGIDFFNVIGER